MPSDSVESFLELAREQRLLPTERLEQLFKQHELPLENLARVCETLVDHGLLTPFQASRIREGRRNELTFAGYTILDHVGTCPGGTLLKALHPSLRSPILIRRLQTDWLQPADNLSAYIQRAQQASTVTHDHLATILEAGASEEQLFVVLEPLEGENLENLVRDIGPMPTFLACQYTRQAALALAAVAGAGMAHGAVSPATLRVGPLIRSSRTKPDGSPLFRPGPQSVLKVTEFGLTPRRPSLPDWIATSDVAGTELVYRAPERTHEGNPTEAGDVYSLGWSLYFMLTARAPFVDDSLKGILAKIETSQPISLAVLRPDLPAELLVLVDQMTAREPAARPTMTIVTEQLAAFTAPSNTVTPAPVVTAQESSIIGGDARPQLVPLKAEPVIQLTPAQSAASPEPVNLVAAATANEWTVTPYEGSTGDGSLKFVPSAAENYEEDESDLAKASRERPDTPRRRRGMSDSEARQEKKKWFMIALGLWLLSIPLWLILLWQWGVIGGGKPPAEVKPVVKRR